MWSFARMLLFDLKYRMYFNLDNFLIFLIARCINVFMYLMLPLSLIIVSNVNISLENVKF